MSETKKGEMSVFWIVVIVLGIAIAIVVWILFFFASETISIEGETFHTAACQANNILASYSILRDFGIHFPKPFCDPIQIDIDGNDCDCEDFTAYMRSEFPIINLYDGVTSTYTSIISDNGKVIMEFEFMPVFDYELTSFGVYRDGALINQPEKVEIKIKAEGVFSRWATCATETIFVPGWHEILSTNCDVTAKSKIAIIFDTMDEDITQINIAEIRMTFDDGFNPPITDLTALLKTPPKTSEEVARKYSYECKEDMEDGECNDEWRTRWAALKLGKLAASCWSMGLEGKRNPGAFACFGGRIKNIPSRIGTDADDLMDEVADAMRYADLRENLTYRQYLSRLRLSGGCPDFVPYLRSPQSFVSWLIPAIENKAVADGYPTECRYALVYTDIHLQSLFWALTPPYSDKIVFC